MNRGHPKCVYLETCTGVHHVYKRTLTYSLPYSTRFGVGRVGLGTVSLMVPSPFGLVSLTHLERLTRTLGAY